jgi:hypothetical protein
MLKSSCLTLILNFAVLFYTKGQIDVYVSPLGNDSNSGTLSKPLKTPEAAFKKVGALSQKEVAIHLRAGTYYLNQPLILKSTDVKGKNVLIESYKDEKVILSAGRKLAPKWEKHNDKIWKAKVSGHDFEMLFVNGKQQHLARYPNYDSTARVFNGTAKDAVSAERMAKWKNPSGGYLHALHQGEWGSFHYKITGVQNGQPELEGGWQNNRPAPLHPKERFVENIFEELDAPGEWFYDRNTKLLYLYPQAGTEANKAVVEVSNLRHIIELRGSEQQPIRNVTVRGILFEHTERTIMAHYEPLLRSDWMIYRGGAVIFENTENCVIQDSEFSHLGGNAVMISGFNRASGVKNSHIHDIGSSAICFIGDSSAVRSPAFRYENFVPYTQMDKTPGPKNNRFPISCFAEDNLIHDIGQIEKQCTGVQIEMASEINVNHNTIYRVPRAGINIGDGAWGGHMIENNDVFETVMETGDHGAFNSWGRDRFWHPNRKTMDSLAREHPELILLDAQKTVTIRNNRFRCDHGWDIDLDDGSSNYHIYNNVCLNGGLKFREGFQRIAENNILVNNSFHPHVWFRNSGDVFRKNILMRPYFPIAVNDWGKEIDYNLFPDETSLKAAQALGLDKHSAFADPDFVNPKTGDFQVKSSSEAITLGFRNFAMNQFGTRNERLKKTALKVAIPPLTDTRSEKHVTEMMWLKTKIRNVSGLGDRSAFGLRDENGVVVDMVTANSPVAESGLQKGDVILKANHEKTDTVTELEAIQQKVNWTGKLEVEVMRNQQIVKLVLSLK